jgi:hypothetical protein
MRRTILWWTTAAVASATAGAAFGAPLGAVSAKVSTADAVVAQCDADGFTHAYTTVHGDVTAVTISGLADPACEGGTLQVAVTDALGAAIAQAGPLTIPADAGTADNSVVLATSLQPSATLVAGIRVVVSGP